MRGRQTNYLCRTLGLLLGVVMSVGLVLAQPAEQAARTAEEEDLKVAFIYNFAKFAVWPPSADGSATSAIRACVYGRIDFQRRLGVIDGQPVGERSLQVSYLSDITALPNCQILIVGQLEEEVLSVLLGAAQRFPILTVSDRADFLVRGGTIEIFHEGQRLRFKVDFKRAQQTGIKLSSKMLKLAVIADTETD